jgi:hypothetical protein
MKTIDTRSLLLGVGIALLFLTLTGGKKSEESADLEVSSGNNVTTVFNKQTKTIYGYYGGFKGNPHEKPDFTAKVSADGSSLTVNQ